MKHFISDWYRYSFVLFFGLGSCSGCDIDRTEVSLSRANPDPQLVDLSTGTCLVNEIEADVSAKRKGRLKDILLKQLEEIFGDSLIHINAVSSTRFKESIPFQISAQQLDTLRKTTPYTYLLSVRAVKPDLLGERVNVDIVIFDLDTRNIIYEQSVLANEYEPQRDNSSFVFWLGHSDYDLMKTALRDALRDLKRGVKKFNRMKG